MSQEFKIVSEQLQSLFQLQTTEKDASSVQHVKAMKQSQQLLDSFHTKPLDQKIYQVAIYALTCEHLPYAVQLNAHA